MKWNKSRIEEILPHVAAEIQLLQPSLSRADDIFIWQPLQSGTYTSRSGYYTVAMQNTSQINTPVGTFNWINHIWAEKYSPKVKLFMWSIIQKAIPLGEELHKRGIQSDVSCKRCKGVETTAHTFFDCPFAQEVWKLIPLKQGVHLATGIDFKEAVVAFKQSFCLPPLGITTNILLWVCWALWSTRNTLLFENRLFTPTEVATKAITLTREWSNAQIQHQVTNKPVPCTGGNRRISSTPSPVTTCKTDAAFDKGTMRAGFAWIFTDPSGSCLYQGSAAQDRISSPLMAEALALRSGITTAVELGFKSSTFYLTI